MRNIYKGFYDALIICYWITCSLFICVRSRENAGVRWNIIW
nr:MAG TPA: hypothetical protein [Caudoviricetes sp.]